MTPLISVLIPAYNHFTEVMACLTSLQMYASKQLAITFLIQDDASPEVYLPAVVPPCSASVKRNPENLGFVGNVNAGAARADGDILFIVNQDVLAVGQDADGGTLSQDWDIHLVNAFADLAVGVVGAKLLFPDGRIQNAGGFFDGRLQPFHRGLGYSNHRYAEVNTPEEVTWTTGAAFAVRRDLFTALGGFDPVYAPSYFEDTDFCLRAREAGFKVWYEPKCVFIHTVGTTGGSPFFHRSAATFRQRWVDSKRITADVSAVKERFW